MRGIIVAGLFATACACPAKQTGGTTGGSAGSATVPATACESVRPKIERLYRAEAQATEPSRVDEAVADNTTMVMNDCTRAPGKVAPCVERVTTVAELEASCLSPLDDEGSEGEALRK